MLTLADIFDDLLPRGTRHVNGPPVTGATISRVAALDGDDTPPVDRATLAVATGVAEMFDANDLLSTAPAALVVSALHPLSATQVDYPVLMLPDGVEPRSVVSLVTGKLDDQRARLAMQGIDVYRRLAEIAIAGKGLPSIVAAVAQRLSLPVSVADDEWRPLCAAGVDGLTIAELDERTLQALRDQLRPILEREHLSSSAPPVLHLRLANDPHIYVVAPIVLPGGAAGYVWADAAPDALDPFVDVAISHAATVCAIEVARQRSVLEAQLHLRGNFVEELLTEGYHSIDAMHQRARFLGHDIDGPHAVAIFDIDHFARYISARPVSGEGAVVKLKERFMRLVADALAEGDAALLWQQSDSVVALLPIRSAVPTTVVEVGRRVEAVRATVQMRLSGPTISAGVGRVYDDATQLRRSYVEAREAVRIGLATVGTEKTTPFEKLGVYRLLFRLRETPELEEFCDELLGPLEEYDRNRGTDLVHTLARYLACNCNVARATEELHLHRNGLLYRLQRITEITHADFNDARQRLSYYLAILGRSLDETGLPARKRVLREEGH